MSEHKSPSWFPFWVICGDCRLVWMAGAWPGELGSFVKGLREASNKCPRCSSKRIMVAKQEGGFCLEKNPG